MRVIDDKIVYIVAKDYDKFLKCLDENRVWFLGVPVVYVCSHCVLAHVSLLHRDHVIQYEDWYMHPDAFEIQQQVKLALLNAT